MEALAASEAQKKKKKRKKRTPEMPPPEPEPTPEEPPKPALPSPPPPSPVVVPVTVEEEVPLVNSGFVRHYNEFNRDPKKIPPYSYEYIANLTRNLTSRTVLVRYANARLVNV